MAGKQNSLILIRVPGHRYIEDNGMVDELTTGSATKQVIPIKETIAAFEIKGHCSSK